MKQISYTNAKKIKSENLSPAQLLSTVLPDVGFTGVEKFNYSRVYKDKVVRHIWMNGLPHSEFQTFTYERSLFDELVSSFNF